MNKKRIALNSFVSAFSFIAGALTIFFLYRFVLQERGADELGIFSLILSFTSLSGLGTAVIAGGVIKFVAKYAALEQKETVVKVIDTNFISFFLLISTVILIGYPILLYFLPTLFDADNIALASALVPVTFAAFFINSLAQVYLLSLDGLQYYYISQLIRAFGRILYLVGVFFFIPKYGIIGMGYAYFFYNLFLFIAAKLFSHIKIDGLSWIPFHFNVPIFKEMLNYGIKFQVTSIAQMTIMPTTKLLLKTFGSLSFVAFFEMAFQLVATLKGGMSALTNVFTPVYATLTEKSPELLKDIYLLILKISCLFTFSIFPLFFLALPFISEVWIGKIEYAFIYSGILLGIAYMISTMAEPQYIRNLGEGVLNPNMYTMIIASIGTLVFGWLLGCLFGNIGVLGGYTIAFILANIYLISSSDIKKTSILSAIFTKDSVLILISAIVFLVVYFLFFEKFIGLTSWNSFGISLLFFLFITVIIISRGTLKKLKLQIKSA